MSALSISVLVIVPERSHSRSMVSRYSKRFVVQSAPYRPGVWVGCGRSTPALSITASVSDDIAPEMAFASETFKLNDLGSGPRCCCGIGPAGELAATASVRCFFFGDEFAFSSL